MKEKYSQWMQDEFILSLFPEDYKGTFLDVGCSYPDLINNTLMLEEKGWTGLSLDIKDFSEQWKDRKTPFYQHDALACDYRELFDKENLKSPIDYLSLDIELAGMRYNALKRIIYTRFEFKVMTIEHDSYSGNNAILEKAPQRNLLWRHGYFLLCADVLSDGLQVEDWWINPKYIEERYYKVFKCSNLEYSEILKLKKL